MSKKTPKFLYRYMSFYEDRCLNIERLRPIFTDNLLYFPSPRLFNDPFDCSPLITFRDATGTDRDKYINSTKPYLYFRNYSEWIAYKYDMCAKIRNNDPDIYTRYGELMENKVMPKVYNGYGILSLSAKENNILMWSHYSDSHTGFCLIFDYQILKVPHQVKWMCYKVKYRKTFPTLHEYVTLDGKDFFEMVLTSKSKHWKYEAEWRLLILVEKDNRERPYPPEMLTGIIFGCRMKEEHKAWIRDWIVHRNPKPKLYQAKINYEKYKLDIEDID